MPNIEAVSYEEVKRRVNIALNEFIEKETPLLARDVSERTLTGALANYLRSEFPLWDVNPEFNRMWKDGKNVPKNLPSKPTRMPGKTGNVSPDIIIHKNGDAPNSNLLVILAKKESNVDSEGEEDMQDLPDYINELGYKYGLFIQFKVKDNAGKRPTGMWFPSEERL